jgi:predicted amidophosphoribosyltransferase
VTILDLLLPARCVVCRASGGKQLCDGCRERLPLLRPPLCERCGAPTAWPVSRCRECSGRRLAFASARAAVEYDESVRRFVSAWKERGLRRLAAEAAALVVQAIPPPRVALVGFVPPDRERVLLRGHHPAERLARELGERWELPVRPLLAWKRTIPHQRGLKLSERRRNVAGAFRPAAETPSRVALVDDVYTSGATAAAAASALRRAGARRVEVVTFARVVR